MSGYLAALAIVTTFRWRSESAALRTTVIGKVTLELGDGGRIDLAPPDPFVAFDRMAPDGRHVLEAGELMPWSSLASVAAYGGPLRLTIHGHRSRALVVTASAKSPAGYSMTSAERSGFAVVKPSRGADGALSIPDKVDGRYFLAAPKAHQFDALRGDERFLLETPGWECRAALPGVAILVTLAIGKRTREVALATDMLVVHGDRRRLSLVGRALLHGEATMLGHRVVPLDEARLVDSGDARHIASEETMMLQDGDDGPDSTRTSVLARHEPAPPTPFAPAAPRRAPTPPSPVAPEASLPADAAKAGATKPQATKAEAATPKVALPKPGAMAKPMVRRR